MRDMAVGIDIGGSHVGCGVVSDDGVIASSTLHVNTPCFRDLLPRLEASVWSLLSHCDVQPAALAGMSVGICCVVDRSGSIAATNGKYDDGKGFNFVEWSAQVFGLRCVVENDARLALLGEHQRGVAKGFEDVVLLTLGTGIGGAVMLNGKLLQSRNGRAGVLAGHLGVDWRGSLCSCGNRGCAEAEASTGRLDALCRGWEGFAGSRLSACAEPINFRLLFAAFDDGDRVAKEVLAHCIGVWSALAVSLVHVYDPQVIVFGGGVMHRHEAILPRLREHVARHAWAGRDAVAILPSTLGSFAALHGALPLLRSQP